MHLNVLLFYFSFCSLFVHAVIHSSTCLAPKTKRPLSLKPRKNMCKLFLKAVSMSLPSSCLPWHFSVSAVFEAWGEKTLHLVQCRVRSQSWRRSLDRCSGCTFIDFERICASRVFSCCLWAVHRAYSACLLWGWRFSVHELPLKLDIIQRTKLLPSAPRPLPQLSHTIAFAFQLLASTASAADGGLGNVQWALELFDGFH